MRRSGACARHTVTAIADGSTFVAKMDRERLKQLAVVACLGLGGTGTVFVWATVIFAGLIGVGTPTQLTLVLLVGCGVPVVALLVGRQHGAAAGAQALAVGWLLSFCSMVLSWLIWPGYPGEGPHEWVALGTAVVPTVLFAVFVGRRLPKFRMVFGATAWLTTCIVCGASLGTHHVASDLPVAARTIRGWHAADMMGSACSVASASLDDDAFSALVGAQHLVQGAPSGRSELESGACGAAEVPAWFAPSTEAIRYADPSRTSRHGTTHTSWCWYDVWRDGEMVYLASGCAWM